MAQCGKCLLPAIRDTCRKLTAFERLYSYLSEVDLNNNTRGQRESGILISQQLESKHKITKNNRVRRDTMRCAKGDIQQRRLLGHGPPMGEGLNTLLLLCGYFIMVFPILC